MTNTEMSNQFDVLYNNITSNQAPGLNEYEKSVFLTKAQDEIVKNYFLPQSNPKGAGFDGNQKRQIDFSMLMRTENGTPAPSDAVKIHPGNNLGYYSMPDRVLLYINEILTVTRGSTEVPLTVVPISYDEYMRMMSKPFKRPLKHQAWRLITSGTSTSYTYTDYNQIAGILTTVPNATATKSQFYATINGLPLAIITNSSDKYLKVNNSAYITANASLVGGTSAALNISSKSTELTNYIDKAVSGTGTIVELIPGNNDFINDYVIRYVARPRPIILTDLTSEGVTLEGETGPLDCELDPILHEEILQRAVELAKVSWTATGADNVQLVMQAGQRSE